LEYVGQKLNTVDEKFIYPRELKLFTYSRDDISDFPSPMKDQNGISSKFFEVRNSQHSFLGWWLLDGGSIVPVLAMNLKGNETILDLCAAPGGKSLMMAQIGGFSKYAL
jgi:16S rRNA C967 or C1407 C5-methylase (RsmB/RsmF family)